jgi:N6-adenosine-specific RNA methylase IME4
VSDLRASAVGGRMTWEGLSPPYRTIVADPPWRYASAATKADAGKQYSTMSLSEIARLPVKALAGEATHLWLWATNGLLEDAYVVLRAWGFAPLTVVTWCKPRPGVGHYLRNNTEHVILASLGRPQVPAEKPLSTWYEWPGTSHSVKPAAFYDLVEQVSPPPRVELFCRQPRFGWDSWGHGYEELAAVGGSAWEVGE